MVYSLLPRLRAASSIRFAGLSVVLLTGAAMLMAGCSSKITDPNNPKFIVAEKGDWKVTRGELDEKIAKLAKEAHQNPDPAKMPVYETAVLDQVVLAKLYLDKAAALQLKDLDKEEAKTLTQIKEQLPPGQDFDQLLKTYNLSLDDLKTQIHEKVAMDKVLEAEAYKNVDPSEQEIQDIYLQHKDSFKVPNAVRASRILVHLSDTMKPADKAAAKKLIDKAYARVTHGEDFAKVASEVSEDASSKAKGGDLGLFPEGENEPEFDKVAFHTKVGTISPVFETQLGYQFLKVTENKPAGIAPLAEVRDFIVSRLKPMKMAQQRQVYEKKLLADGGVTIYLTRTEPPAPPAEPPAGPGPDDSAPPAAPAPAPAPTPAPAPAPAVAPKH